MDLMWTEFGILQSLIRSESLVEGANGEGLLWTDFLGAIWEKFEFSEEKFVKGGLKRKVLLGSLEIFQKFGFKENTNAKGKVKIETMEWNAFWMREHWNWGQDYEEAQESFLET